MAGRDVNLKDEEEVKQYLENLGIEYRFGCYHEKNPKSCHLLADYMEAVKRDFHRALRIYETNCLDYGYGHSCHKVGGYRSVGRACSKDLDEAYDYFVKGCQLGHFAACYNAGLMDSDKTGSLGARVKQQPDPKQAVFFFKKACDQGEFADACYQYSSLCIKGQDDIVEKNMEDAFRYSEKACHLGNLQSCINLSLMYKKGEGVAQNEDESKKYTAIAREMQRQLSGDGSTLRFGEAKL